MDYPRVNLLRKSEQRYQGAVSRRFIAIGAVVTPIMLIAVLSAIKLVQYAGVQADLKASKEIWDNLEPKLELFNEESRGLQTNRQILLLLEGWKDSRVTLVDLMDEIQNAVPENIQFNRLTLKGKVEPGIYRAAADMKLRFELQIDGTSQGNRAEDDVWAFHKELLATKGIRQVFDTVDLSNMRKRESRGELNVREFRIVGSSEAGGAR